MRVWFAFALAGCASSAVPSARFANAPPVRAVDDRRDTPNKPEKLQYSPTLQTGFCFYDDSDGWQIP